MASSSLKRYIDDLDSSTEDEDFEGIDTSDAGETEESDIESSSESTDSGDDDTGNARDWCEITASGLSGLPRFPFTENNAPLEANFTTAMLSGSCLKQICSSHKTLKILHM
ncbi:piggyBac transposable element-derived protein 4 [Nephila pilipes]|uniref:PiggyBac transposable element-derived protein 4 n=1 Tax=Nephila pilipes TaxID=299642 RepID=A0A8X6TIJ1_NEPPI|nr:piggyBac transposable element-derived protein 4 [Nephila pilipes]GFT94881.1 piggyBac transposable element-derived protein 4 [Nephila pilipes]GFU44604.1 piggyBac transposable element-derived protein 4 [Nephila pilipes]